MVEPVCLRVAPRVLFIDDDLDYLDALSATVPESVGPSFHSEPSAIDAALANNEQNLKAERAMLAGFAKDSETQKIPLAVEYFRSGLRHEIVSVLVSDYHMPAENGVKLCARHHQECLRRILLTGVADVEVAIQAFNAGHIELYLPRQSPQLLSKLKGSLSEQINKSLLLRGRAIQDGFNPRQLALFSRPEIYAALMKLLAKFTIREYIFMGQPCGLVGVDASGQLLWVQIEDEISLAELVDVLTDCAADPADVRAVIDRKSLVSLDLASQMEVESSTAPMTVLSVEPFVCAAVFDIPHDEGAFMPPFNFAPSGL